MWASTRTVSLIGAVGHLIDVQVDVSKGVVATALIGRPDVAISEARDRCRTAVHNSGFDWPSSRRITISLSPADIPKRGSHFDLAIAAGVLAATDEELPPGALDGTVLIGELSLDGRMRCVPGVLPMTVAAAARGIRRVYVPEPQVEEASLVPDVEVVGLRSLRQLMAVLKGEPVPDAPPVEALTSQSLVTWRGEDALEDADMADVAGMSDARYALEVAAAGGHSLLLSGPKGSGKTTLAERLHTLLPDLGPDEALEVTAISSLAGTLPRDGRLARRPPFRAPHHSATRTAVLGGGTGRVRPGEVSKAHLGVLFLDEFPLFGSDIIEGLRQPLESGQVSVARGEEEATYPARALVVFACNPCRCGNFSGNQAVDRCECRSADLRHYRARVSGPVADRVDITRHIVPPTEWELTDRMHLREDSATIRARVTAARARQAARLAGTPWRLNAHVPGPVLTREWPLSAGAAEALGAEVTKGALTQRGATRVHRLAWTVADLRALDRPDRDEMEVALALRQGQPVPADALPQPRLRSLPAAGSAR
ncbi:MAG TPA: YifB family Mg chelatase-like AAA ATPase [Marmoricola sp.]|nr:YifB family Mg chelatase-like AAA ATPase [Marmoricola sp.]